MVGVTLFLAAQAITVGGFDKVPPLVLAETSSETRSDVAEAAKRCGIRATWEYEGALWAHADAASPKQLACLSRYTRTTPVGVTVTHARGSVD